MAKTPTQRVIKVGDSLAVIIPAYIAREMRIQRGTAVAVGVVSPNHVAIKIIADEEIQKMRTFAVIT